MTHRVDFALDLGFRQRSDPGLRDAISDGEKRVSGAAPDLGAEQSLDRFRRQEPGVGGVLGQAIGEIEREFE